MNRHTFGDATSGKKKSIDIELAMNADDDDDDDEMAQPRQERVEGEIDQDPEERFNDVGEVMEPFNMKNEVTWCPVNLLRFPFPANALTRETMI